MENYLLQLTEPLRPFLNEGLSHDSRLTLLGAAADWTIWIPVEEEIGHENLFFPGEFINQWRKKFLVEVLPCFQKGFTELTIGEPHELACKATGCVVLLPPGAFVSNTLGLAKTAMLVFLAASAGALVVSADFFAYTMLIQHAAIIAQPDFNASLISCGIGGRFTCDHVRIFIRARNRCGTA